LSARPTHQPHAYNEAPTPTATVIPTATLKPGQERVAVVEVIDGVTIIVEMNVEILEVCYKAAFMSDSDPDEIKDKAKAVNRAV
jgi:hypothetical protein